MAQPKRCNPIVLLTDAGYSVPQGLTDMRAFASGKPALINVAVQQAISPRAEAAITRRLAAMKK